MSADTLKEVTHLSFEDALAELEKIVRELESGKVKLDQAVAAFERGMILKNHCEKKLLQAKARVDAIIVEGGNISTQSFAGKDV